MIVIQVHSDEAEQRPNYKGESVVFGVMSKVQSWTLAFPQNSSEWHQCLTGAGGQSRGSLARIPTALSRWLFSQYPGKGPICIKEHWPGACAAQTTNPWVCTGHGQNVWLDTFPASSWDGTNREASAVFTKHLFGSLISGQQGLKHTLGGRYLVSSPADAVTIVKYSSAGGEVRLVLRREICWGLLNAQKTQAAEEIPKLKAEAGRMLQGNIPFAFPGFASHRLSQFITAGDRILNWRRPWSDPGQLLWWAHKSH